MLKKFEGERRKQLLIAGISFLLIGAGLYMFDKMTAPEKKKSSVPVIKLEDETSKDEATILKEVYGKKLTQLETKIEELKRELENVKKEKTKELPTALSPPPPPPPPPGEKEISVPSLPSSSLPEEKPKEEKIQILENLIEIVKPEKKEKKKIMEESKKEERKIVIPKGSFVKAVLLSGLDAPAGGKALSNPHPVLLKITDEAVLPNFWKADIKDCFLIGSGYGDLSSERAYIRIETLSCVKNNGEAIEKKVKGFVAGEDGKEGLRGRVVTRQGQILARALIAGFLEGISKAFAQANTNIIVSPQGSLTSVKPSQAFSVGIAGGFSEAAKKLADFYMKLATQMFPVIEINAGRRVDVVFLSSVSFGGENEESVSSATTTSS